MVCYKNKHYCSNTYIAVIGRKVNMAARLMMHYPDKVTCDDSTFQTCRLPAQNFDVLVTKRMKGLRNVGIIREFTEQVEDDSAALNSVPHFGYPFLGM
jgi:adenylate cyclase 10